MLISVYADGMQELPESVEALSEILDSSDVATSMAALEALSKQKGRSAKFVEVRR